MRGEIQMTNDRKYTELELELMKENDELSEEVWNLEQKVSELREQIEMYEDNLPPREYGMAFPR